MKAGLVIVVASVSLATAQVATAAPEAPPRRVVVAGPQDDAIAGRVHRELTALGFETVRVGALEGCARSAVVLAATESGAIAAACSDGEQVGIWVSDGATLRLRDVVVAREEGDRGREITAVRAAEITRATVALRESEEEAAKSTPSPAPPEPKQSSSWETFNRPQAKPAAPKAVTRRTARFLASAGMSSLMGVDASVAAFSAQVQVGVFRSVSAAARIEYPVESQSLGRSGSTARIAPAFVGLGADVPLAAASSFIVPRFGAGLGVAWVHATKPAAVTFDATGSVASGVSEGVDSVASPALYGSAGLSMRIVGPLRIGVDGVFGSTMSRMVVRDRGTQVAYWGQPFGVLALRMELMIQ